MVNNSLTVERLQTLMDLYKLKIPLHGAAGRLQSSSESILRAPLTCYVELPSTAKTSPEDSNSFSRKMCEYNSSK